VVFNYCKALFALPALRPLVAGETAGAIELRHHGPARGAGQLGASLGYFA